jgi:hypothetical protein
MATVTVPNAGTYELLVDTGAPVQGFRLDDPVRGVLNSTEWVLDGLTDFASIAQGVTNLNIRRGREDDDDAFNNGTMVFTLNDTLVDGVFNPFDSDSPYYDPSNDEPGLAPGRAVQLIRYNSSNNPEPLFTGFIVNYDYDFQLGGLDTVTVFCVDNMYRLAQTFITGHNPTKEFTGDRINAILDRTGVNYPTGTARDIAAGTVELGGSSSYAIAEGTNVKAYFDQITYSAERGRIFVDREGVLVSQNRIGNVFGPPEVQFSDNGSGTDYNQLEISFQAENIINRVAITPAGGTQQLANDTASQSKYFIKSLYIDGSLLEENADALTLANYLLEGEPTPKFTSLQTWFGSMVAADRDAVSILEIGSYVSIEKAILIGGVSTPTFQDSTVEGIEHRIAFDRGHTTKIFTTSAVVVYELILDDPVYGVLDSTNVLG